MGHEVVYQMGTLGGVADVEKGKVLHWKAGLLGGGVQQDFPGDPS